MLYTELQALSGAPLKCLCGVSRATFSRMVEMLRPHLKRQGRRDGQTKLSALRPTAGGVGILARVQEPVLYWYELGCA